ncbi:D-2-hydroxyacid dehydrogenase [Bradyrhizobium sp. NP1]|uniref:D-2-hydroxyacid dehydrogenase n=1 Tax=Bradyrhizobium sp. NP1 TaxID=3049772 RepID=UPI0025A659C6|nr:D-2-hydroxyacid dehydrogenase [Bradyrhizobium sp. NP1]WJR74993.1 D-2-hydroxyacid dehydrogenase [Bradyrhizobium sp. NP1]
MGSFPATDRPLFSKEKPFRIHIENETRLMPVFTVYPKQYEEALQRFPDIAKITETSWGIDGDVFDRAIGNADAMIGYRFPRDRLAEKAPRLKLVQVLGAGVDYMLPFDWVPKGLTLTTNCGAHVPKASQSALMAILMANAQIPKLITAQRRKEWNRIFTPTVEGKTLLIVGVGHIGGGAAEQAKKLGMRVIGIRRSKEPHPAVSEMHGPGALHELLPRADIVLVNISLTSTTRFIMAREEFRRMKRGAAFINMSRGGLVDPKALEEALRTDQIGCAIIDVTYPEPLPADASLWDAPNLLITPHVLSDDLDQYVPRTLDIFFNNVRRHLAGEPLTNVVDVSREY